MKLFTPWHYVYLKSLFVILPRLRSISFWMSSKPRAFSSKVVYLSQTHDAPSSSPTSVDSTLLRKLWAGKEIIPCKTYLLWRCICSDLPSNQRRESISLSINPNDCYMKMSKAYPLAFIKFSKVCALARVLCLLDQIIESWLHSEWNGEFFWRAYATIG